MFWVQNWVFDEILNDSAWFCLEKLKKTHCFETKKLENQTRNLKIISKNKKYFKHIGFYGFPLEINDRAGSIAWNLKTLIFDRKLKNTTKNLRIRPKPKKSKFLFRGVVGQLKGPLKGFY